MDYKKEIKESGEIELFARNSGVWLVESEYIQADQKRWYEGDSLKKFDFSTADYWIITQESDPFSIDIDDVDEFVEEFK